MASINRYLRNGGDGRAGLFSLTSPLWVFLAFFAWMLLQHRFIFLYHDDYGYASLSYAVNVPSLHGHAFNLSQLFEFLIKHYNRWGGRVIPIGVGLLVLRGGIWSFRIVQSLVLTLILAAGYLIVQRSFNRTASGWLVAFTLCCCYGLIDVELHNDGTYWPTASIVYVWPMLALFLAVAIHLGGENGLAGWPLVVLGVTYFVVGSSQEQLGVVGLVFTGGLTLAHAWLRKSRRLLAVDGLALACVLAGFAFLMLSPGNLTRLNGAAFASFTRLSLAQKVSATLPGLIAINFGIPNRLILLLWSGLCVAAMGTRYRSGKPHRLLYLLTGLVCACFGTLLAASLLQPFSIKLAWIFQQSLSAAFLGFWGSYLCALSLALVLFCLEDGFYPLLFLYAGGLASQAAMIFSPGANMRSSLIFVFTLFPLLAAILASLPREAHRLWPVWLALLVLFAVAAFNSIFILQGYAANRLALESNDQVLQSAAQEVHNGVAIQTIELQRLPDSRFGGEMPYTPGYGYIPWWIKAYYDLPSDINLTWK